jgi:GntR family carbon starvation induced transcriptional regulator
LRGQLLPGTKLKFHFLQETYGLNVGTLREGLARLTAEGLVIAQGQKGFTVSPVSEQDLLDLTELRLLVDPLALRLSIERGDLAWETQVLSSFHELSRAPRNLVDKESGANKEWERRHRAFHRNLVAGSGSQVLIQCHHTLFDRAERYRRIVRAKRGKVRDVQSEHESIMRATIDRNADVACALLAAHLVKTRDAILRSFPLPEGA